MASPVESAGAQTTARRHLQLNAHAWVEVRSKAEILATLDEHGRLDGMPFMPEMLQYCGQRLQVFKRAHKTCDTITRTGTRLVDASVHLTDARCDGTAHGGCGAACLFFWKEAWLKRLDQPAQPKPPAALDRGCSDQQLMAATRVPAANPTDESLYACQATQLLGATSRVPRWDLRHIIEDYASGNTDIQTIVRGAAYRVSSVLIRRTGRAARWLGIRSDVEDRLIGVYDSFQRWLPRGVPYPRRTGTIAKGARTPSEPPKHLQPGEWVRVKTYEQILATLDRDNKNRGLYFDAEHVPYCGKVQRVRSVVTQIVDERSGKMLRFKTPCVILEGAYCQSAYSEHRLFCPRAIYPYWRELWLERVDPPVDAVTRDVYLAQQPSHAP